MKKNLIEKLKALSVYFVIFWFKKLFKKEKKNNQLLFIKQTKKGPPNPPIIFDSISDAMEYFKNNP